MSVGGADAGQAELVTAPDPAVPQADWLAMNVPATAEHGSLSPHLIVEIDDYFSRLESSGGALRA